MNEWEDLYKQLSKTPGGDNLENVHVMPAVDIQDHDENKMCWCQPSMNYKDAVTQCEVWVHNHSSENAN